MGDKLNLDVLVHILMQLDALQEVATSKIRISFILSLIKIIIKQQLDNYHYASDT